MHWIWWKRCPVRMLGVRSRLHDLGRNSAAGPTSPRLDMHFRVQHSVRPHRISRLRNDSGAITRWLTIVAVIGIAACAPPDRMAEDSTGVLLHAGLDVPVVKVASEVFADDPALGRLTEVVRSGEWLWVSDRPRAPFLHLLRLDGTLVGSLGRGGQGPGEFVDLIGLSPAPEAKGSVWASDWRSGRVTRVDPVVPAARNEPKVITVKDHVLGTSYRAFGPGRFIAYTKGERGFVLMDTAGRQVGTRPFTLPGDESIPSAARHEAVNGSGLCLRRDTLGFAIHYVNAGRIQLYDADARLIDSADVPYPSTESCAVDAEKKSGVRVPARHYYKSCTFSNEHLFGLFLGRAIPAGGFPPGTSGSSRFVHMFALEGRLIRVLELDRPVDQIEAEPGGGYLYALTRDNAQVLRFKVP